VSLDPGLRPGVNVAYGRVTHPAVADATGNQYTRFEEALEEGAAAR
jgi:alanine dehydrogenase